MTAQKGIRIIQLAYSNGEMAKLLMGEDPYSYLPRHSPATGRTDLAEILRIAYDQWPSDQRNELRQSIIDAINSLLDTYDGLEAVAACIVIETLRRSRNRSPLGLPLEDLTRKLRLRIDENRAKLVDDRSGTGQEWKSGRLGELRRLSRIVVELGGSGFVED